VLYRGWVPALQANPEIPGSLKDTADLKEEKALLAELTTSGRRHGRGWPLSR